MKILALNYDIENDMKYIMPLHKIISRTGLLPFANWETYKPNAAARMKLLLVSTVVIVCYGISSYDRVRSEFYDDKTVATIILDKITYATLFSLTMVSVMELGLYKTNELRRFLLNLGQIDGQLKRTRIRLESKYSFHVKLLACVLCYFIYSILWLLHCTFTKGVGSLVRFFPREIHNYYAFAMVLLLYNYVWSMLLRFRKLNGEFSEVSQNCVGAWKTNDVVLYFKVRRLVKIYLHSVDNIKLCNSIFGWQILLWAARMMTDLLLLLNYSTIIIQRQHLRFSILIIYLKIIINWSIASLLATACKKTAREATKTIKISYRLMHKLRSSPHTKQTSMVHEELFLLVQNIYVSSPHISAAGFFPIDYTMLFTIIGGLTSYLIVMIQFNK